MCVVASSLSGSINNGNGPAGRQPLLFAMRFNCIFYSSGKRSADFRKGLKDKY